MDQEEKRIRMISSENATFAGTSARTVPGQESSAHDAAPEPGDVLIDINDRFPPDSLSDLFHQAAITGDSSATDPLRADETAMNPFWESTPPNESAWKDVPLTLGTSQIEAEFFFHNAPSAVGASHLEAQIVSNEDEDIPQEPSGTTVGAETRPMQTHAVDKGRESPIKRIPESENELAENSDYSGCSPDETAGSFMFSDCEGFVAWEGAL
ncbi:hypothetical protein ACLOJK_020103 [Asimina triloba]